MVTVYPRADKCSAVAQPQYPSPPVEKELTCQIAGTCLSSARMLGHGIVESFKHGSPMTMTRGFPPPAPFELLVGTS